MQRNRRRGRFGALGLLALAAAALLVFGGALYFLGRPPGGGDRGAEVPSPLVVYCAAGLRVPIEEITATYTKEYGAAVQLQFGGSQTLLSQIELSKAGDLYIPADDGYSQQAQEKGLSRESLPLAEMRPVVAVKKGNPKNIRGAADLYRADVRTALANPEQAAVGKLARRLLSAAGRWEPLAAAVEERGVFKPTVTDVANDVKLGTVDAAILWDTTVAQYPELEAVAAAELAPGVAHVSVEVLSASEAPTAALRLARYLASHDRGQATLRAHGFNAAGGDRWADRPEITFFCGSVNRRAVEAVVQRFERREGVKVNTVYNGCGILTAQMEAIRSRPGYVGFPDTYMACDRYYLDNVKSWFQEDIDVSDTDVVIVVSKGNPLGVKSLADLARPGVRVSVGQPEQCTIGVLTRNMLKAEGVYDEVMKNVATQTATSAMLIPTVSTGSVDATLAYATDAKAEGNRIDVVRIDTPASRAVQPFAIARTSENKHLGRRLLQAIAGSREAFETAGFHFRIDDSLSEPVSATAPASPPSASSQNRHGGKPAS